MNTTFNIQPLIAPVVIEITINKFAKKIVHTPKSIQPYEIWYRHTDFTKPDLSKEFENNLKNLYESLSTNLKTVYTIETLKNLILMQAWFVGRYCIEMSVMENHIADIEYITNMPFIEFRKLLHEI